tara:strand:- start:18 stop:497 length:480 start_codon:yes stop_codon:yes gene_type:complete
MNYITGILIDPFLKKLTNVNVGTDHTLQDMYKHIGCSMVEVVSFGDVNDLWVDEEALLKRDQRFFKVHNLPFGHHGVIAGKALLLKCGDNGGTEDCTLDIHEVTPRISWDFTHNGKIYNSDTGLFTRVEVVNSDKVSLNNSSDVSNALIDNIKSIHVID